MNDERSGARTPPMKPTGGSPMLTGKFSRDSFDEATADGDDSARAERRRLVIDRANSGRSSAVATETEEDDDGEDEFSKRLAAARANGGIRTKGEKEAGLEKFEARAEEAPARAEKSRGRGSTASESSSSGSETDSSDSDSSDSSSSSSSSGSDSELKKKDEYAIEGSLPPRERPDDRTFWARCYQETAKFCGLGILLEDVPDSSDDESESEGMESDSSDASRYRRHNEALHRNESFLEDSSDSTDLDEDLARMAEEEEKMDLYPSPAIIDAEFQKMKKRLAKQERRNVFNLEQEKIEYVTQLSERRRHRSATWMLHQFVNSKFFNLLTALMILYSTVVCGMVAANPTRWSESKFEVTSFLVLNIAFAVECGMRIMSSGVTSIEEGVEQLVKLKPLYYFHDTVNCFDFVVTVLSFMEYVVNSGGALDAIRALRLIRLLRVLRMVEDMRVILDGVIQGILNIAWILVLLGVVVYIYAVFGVILFGANDPRNFRSLGVGIGTVISIATMSDWLGFLYVNYYGCDEYGYETATDAPYCTAPKAHKVVATIYISTMIVVLGNIMMSLFIGVITNKLEDAAEKLREEKAQVQATKEANIADDLWTNPDALDAKLGRENHKALMYHLNLLSGVRREGEVREAKALATWKLYQLRLRRIVTHTLFELTVIGFIICAGVFSGIGVQDPSSADSNWYKTMEKVFLGVFATELGLKFIAHLDKAMTFFTGKDKWWNLFDMFVVFVGLIPNSFERLATVVRMVRLLRILRLVRVIKQLQVVVLSLVAGVQSIIYVAMMMIIVFYVYAVAGVTMFSRNDPFHFGNLMKAILTLFTVSFLEDWRPVFDINFRGCDHNLYGRLDNGRYYAESIGMEYSEASSICTSPEASKWFSVVFFSTYILISAMVLVSAFIGIIVTSMQNASGIVRDRLAAEGRFKETQAYFSLSDDSVKSTEEVFRILDSGFTGALTAEIMLEKMDITGVPSNPEFLKRTFATVNSLTDKPFDCSDFLLLTALAERARAMQEKYAEDASDGIDFVSGALAAYNKKRNSSMSGGSNA
jgi:hypothetical protein